MGMRKRKKTLLGRILSYIWAGIESIIYILLILIIIGSLIASVFVLKIFAEYSGKLPDPGHLIIDTGYPTQIFDRNGTLIATLGSKNRYVPLKEMSPYLIKAVLAIEDHYFYQHPGISIKATIRAIVVNILHRGIAQGGSTITQQLARTLFGLGLEQTITRKIKEAVLALRLEQRYSKDEILEMYLNTVYLGAGCKGVWCASMTYFGKPPSDLTLPEAAMIAGLINSPTALCPLYNYDGAWERAKVVLEKMLTYGYISQDEYQKAISSPPKIRSPKRVGEEIDPSIGYYLDYAIPIILKTFGEDTVYKGGLKIYTSLDVNIQKLAAESLKESLKYYREKWMSSELYDEKNGVKIPQPQGAIVVINPQTGSILAMVGGENYELTKFNRAVSKRQTGSAIKPILYSSALQYGTSMPGDFWESKPLNIKLPNGEVWSPGEFNGRFWGWITMREALVESSNPVTVQIGMATGVDTFVYRGALMGLQTPLHPYLSSFLGATDLSPLEMAVAYSPFANGGFAIEHSVIEKVIDHRGHVIWEHSPSKYRVLNPDAHALAVDLLRDVFAHKHNANRLNKLHWDLGGKTGTTDERRNAWFIGFGGDFVASVYIGLDSYNMKLTGKARKFMMGPGIAAYTWGTLLGKLESQKVFPGTPIPTAPHNLVQVNRCKIYGENDPQGETEEYADYATPEGRCPTEGVWAFVGVDYYAKTYTLPTCDEFSIMKKAMVPYWILDNFRFICNTSPQTPTASETLTPITATTAPTASNAATVTVP